MNHHAPLVSVFCSPQQLLDWQSCPWSNVVFPCCLRSFSGAGAWSCALYNFFLQVVTLFSHYMSTFCSLLKRVSFFPHLLTISDASWLGCCMQAAEMTLQLICCYMWTVHQLSSSLLLMMICAGWLPITWISSKPIPIIQVCLVTEHIVEHTKVMLLCVTCEQTSNRDDDETVRMMASKLLQSRSGSLAVPMKSSTPTSVKMSLTQQFHAAGISLHCVPK